MIKKFKLALTIVTLMSGVTACDIRDINDDSSTPKKFAAEVIDGNSFNEFAVRLHLPDGNGFVIQRKNADQVELQTAATGDYLDQNVSAGVSYKYAFGAIQGKKFTTQGEISVDVPKDFLVKETTTIQKEDLPYWNHIRDLTILPGQILVTNGFDLNLHVRHLNAQSGSIQTFLNGTTAAAGTAGRSAGEFHLVVDSGEGSLAIIMRGENGGPGALGATGIPFHGGGPGGIGADGGDSGTLHLRVPTGLKVEAFHSPGKGGLGGEGGRGGYAGNCRPSRADQVDDECPMPEPMGAQGPSGISGRLGQTCEVLSGESEESCSSGQVYSL